MASTESKADVVRSLSADLDEEQQSLRRVLASITEAEWSRPTPAKNWTTQDQIAHLAHFDFVTRLAISQPERFIDVRGTMTDLQTYVDHIGPANLSRTSEDMRRWWAQESEKLHEAISAADPNVRAPWFGPAMSLPSKITARIMETWAHGQDVRDALEVIAEPSPRLPHVARIGALTFPNSFTARGLDVPDQPVRVVLDTPDGHERTAGPEDAEDVVSGPIEDFCLVVTQRRHIADTSLQTVGATAAQWMEIAQAFAGPAGEGRRPGQFARRDPLPAEDCDQARP